MKRESKNSLVFFGDSICAGYGVGEEKSFPTLLLKSGMDIKNLSLSGATTEDMRYYLKELLDIKNYGRVFLMLGFNDILNSKSVSATIDSLKELEIEIANMGYEVIYGVYPDFHLEEVVEESPMIDRGLINKFLELQSRTVDLANESGNKIIDLREVISKREVGYENNFFDGIHLNTDGNRKIYHYLLQNL